MENFNNTGYQMPQFVSVKGDPFEYEGVTNQQVDKVVEFLETERVNQLTANEKEDNALKHTGSVVKHSGSGAPDIACYDMMGLDALSTNDNTIQNLDNTGKLKKLRCKICHSETGTTQNLIKHYKDNHKNRILYNCHFCSKYFISKIFAANHVKHFHKYEVMKIKNSLDKKRTAALIANRNVRAISYKCDHCFHLFQSKLCLQCHECSAKPKPQFIKRKILTICNLPCQFCSDIFVDYLKLSKHVRESHHTCVICSETLENHAEFTIHESYHALGLIYFHRCAYCPAEYKELRDVLCHVSKNHPTKNTKNCYKMFKKYSTNLKFLNANFACAYCDEKIPRLNDLLKHLENIHKISQCLYCHKHFVKKATEITSRKISVPISVPISASSKEDNEQGNTNMHIINVPDSQQDNSGTSRRKLVFFCSKCSNNFANESDLIKHQLVHESTHRYNEKHSCSKCTAKTLFQNYCSLKIHCIRMHGFDFIKNPENLDSDKIMLKCEICLAIFSKPNLFYAHCNPYSYYSHLSNHCTKCSLKFKTLNEFQIHCAQIHGTNAIFTCKLCANEYPDNSKLNEHVKKYHNAEFVHCKHCSKDFKIKFYINKHMNQCPTNSPHQYCICPFCRENFKDINNFQVHVKSHLHTLCFNHQCDICLNYFASKFNFLDHKNTVHSNVEQNKIVPAQISSQVKSKTLQYNKETSSREVVICATNSQSQMGLQDISNFEIEFENHPIEDIPEYELDSEDFFPLGEHHYCSDSTTTLLAQGDNGGVSDNLGYDETITISLSEDNNEVAESWSPKQPTIDKQKNIHLQVPMLQSSKGKSTELSSCPTKILTVPQRNKRVCDILSQSGLDEEQTNIIVQISVPSDYNEVSSCLSQTTIDNIYLQGNNKVSGISRVPQSTMSPVQQGNKNSNPLSFIASSLNQQSKYTKKNYDASNIVSGSSVQLTINQKPLPPSNNVVSESSGVFATIEMPTERPEVTARANKRHFVDHDYCQPVATSIDIHKKNKPNIMFEILSNSKSNNKEISKKKINVNISNILESPDKNQSQENSVKNLQSQVNTLKNNPEITILKESKTKQNVRSIPNISIIHQILHTTYCNFCGVTFPNQLEYESHLQCDVSNKKLPCLFCEKVCDDPKQLELHIRQTHNACKVCNLGFSSQEQLASHEREHNLGLILVFQCWCNQEFKLRDEYVKHMANEHKQHIDITSQKLLKRKTVTRLQYEHLICSARKMCPYCNKYFYDENKLQSHKSTIHNVHNCRVCKSHFIGVFFQPDLVPSMCVTCDFIKNEFVNSELNSTSCDGDNNSEMSSNSSIEYVDCGNEIKMEFVDNSLE